MKKSNKLPIQKQKEIAGRLKYLRTTAGYTQKDVAQKMDVTEKTYRKWEVGVYSGKTGVEYYPAIEYDNLFMLAEIYNVSIDYLLCRSNCTCVDNHYISKETGLSEKSIRQLKHWHSLACQPQKKYDWARKSISALNNLFSCEIYFSHDVLTQIYDYCYYRNVYENQNSGKIDSLQKFQLALFNATNGLSNCIKDIFNQQKTPNTN